MAAEAFTYCSEDGRPLDNQSSGYKRLRTKPSPAMLKVYQEVPDSDYCDYKNRQGKQDFSIDYAANPALKTGHCAPICNNERWEIGMLSSCFHRNLVGGIGDTVAAYTLFFGEASKAGVKLSMSPERFRAVLTSPNAERERIRLSGRGGGISVQIGAPHWDRDWKSIVAEVRSKILAGSANCKGLEDKKAAQRCHVLEQSGAAFEAKLKLLERSLLLDRKFSEKATVDPLKFKQCKLPSALKGGAPPVASEPRMPLSANRRIPKTIARGFGKSTNKCDNPAVSTNAEVRCEQLDGLGLRSWVDEVKKVVRSPGLVGNYVDLLRIKGISDLMGSYRKIMGKPLGAIPKKCSGRFESGIKAANVSLSDGEKRDFIGAQSLERLNQIRKKAIEAEALRKSIRDALSVKHYNCRKNGEARDCELNPDYDAAQARLFGARVRLRETLLLEPLLTARNAKPEDELDLPAVAEFASAKSDDELKKAVLRARGRLGSSIVANISKFCNDANDKGGWGTDSESVGWYDLVTTPSFTKGVLSQFGIFDDTQRCLAAEAEAIMKGRSDAKVFTAIGCVAGTIMSGPFVGLPCAAMLASMSRADAVLAENRFVWISECQEQAHDEKNKALCGTDDYLAARAKYEAAVEEKYLSYLGVAAEGAGVLLHAAKVYKAAQLAERARQLEAAGNEAAKLAALTKQIERDLAIYEARQAAAVAAKTPAGEIERLSAALPKSAASELTVMQASDGSIVYLVSDVSIPSPLAGRPYQLAFESKFVVTGESAQELAKKAVNWSGELEELGRGGMQVVFVDPTDPLKVIKVYDGSVMYELEMRVLSKQIDRGMKLLSTGNEASVSEGRVMIATARKEIAEWAAKIPPGWKYPPEFDEYIARMIHRQKALAADLRYKVLPRLKIPRTDGYSGYIEVTMCDGFEEVTANGVSRVGRVRLGPVEPGNLASDTWVEAGKYAKTLEKDSEQLRKLLEVDAEWRKAFLPYNEQIKEANVRLGMAGLTKGGQRIGFDIGYGKSPLDNVFVRLDSHGNVVEIRIGDF